MLAPVSSAYKVARVEYSAAQASAAIALLRGAGPETRGPGLDQSDAIQVATHLALLRHEVLGAGRAKVAVYRARIPAGRTFTVTGDPMGEFLGTFYPGEGPRQGVYRIPIVGTEPLFTRPPGPGLPEDWSRSLALAIDELLARIAKADEGASQPAGARSTADLSLLPFAIVAVIVGGAAAAIVSSVALWRFLAPETRIGIAAVEQAGSDYAARLRILKETGTLPAPSPNELASAAQIEKLASAQRPGKWMLGGAVAAGALAGLLLSIALGGRDTVRANPSEFPRSLSRIADRLRGKGYDVVTKDRGLFVHDPYTGHLLAWSNIGSSGRVFWRGDFAHNIQRAAQ